MDDGCLAPRKKGNGWVGSWLLARKILFQLFLNEGCKSSEKKTLLLLLFHHSQKFPFYLHFFLDDVSTSLIT